MKNKVLTVILFIFFAILIPIAAIGCLMTVVWFIGAVIDKSTFIEFFMSFVGLVISVTYIITYIYSLKRTLANKKITIKTFLPAFHCLVALLYLISLTPVGNYVDNSQKHFGFAKKDFIVVDELDTHGGFLGDGDYYLILDCSENKERALEKLKGWKELPLSENLEIAMYGGEKGGVTYGYQFYKDAHMPEIKNGYYMYEDRYPQSTDSKDESDFLDRHSFNFSIAIYDCDTDRLYYFEIDT